jgi:hypothetical protein
MRKSLHNERRVPRVPFRVWATVEHRGRQWPVETEDIGPGGCLVVSDRHLISGLGLKIVLRCQAVSDPLAADGSVAWFLAPRGGISFGDRGLALRQSAGAWFRGLLSADPRLRLVTARVPRDIALDAPLFLRPPTRIVDLSCDEALLVGLFEQGMAAQELLSRAGLGEHRGSRGLFGLFEKRAFTLSMQDAGDAWKWRAALAAAGHPLSRTWSEREGSPARASPPRPASPPPVKAGVAVPAGVQTPAQVAPGAPASDPMAVPERHDPWCAGAAVTARLLRGVSSSLRSPEAEAVLADARAAEAAGHVAEAIQLLRRSLALAPQDREIATALGRLAFQRPMNVVRRYTRVVPPTP